MELYDIAVIGGGINGAGIARDAAGRGLKVLLAEQDDFASATSSAITRDYMLLLDEQGPPLLSVFGGKITTYRRLAEQVLEKLARWIPAHRSWTHVEALPGGDFGGRDFPAVLGEYRSRYSGLEPHWLARLLRRHGTLAGQILDSAKAEADLGENFGGGLYERELAYLVEYEWARSGADVLWRRTKCGLHMTEARRRRVDERVMDGR